MFGTWRPLRESLKHPLIFRSLAHPGDPETWYYLSNMDPKEDVFLFTQLDADGIQLSQVRHCAAIAAYYDKERQLPIAKKEDINRASLETNIIDYETTADHKERLKRELDARTKAYFRSHLH